MLLMNILPLWADDTCNMDVIKLEENVELIKEQAKVIAECKATMEALKNTTEALNRTIQDQASKINKNEADVQTLNKTEGEIEHVKLLLGHKSVSFCVVWMQFENELSGDHNMSFLSTKLTTIC